VNPCITCTQQCGAEQKLMPIIEEQCARNERTSRLWAPVALFEHAAAPGQARAAPVEHPAPPGWLELHPSSILWFRGGLERHPSSILRLRGKLDWHFSSLLLLRGCHFEPSAAPGLARAAISSNLRLRARLRQQRVRLPEQALTLWRRTEI
jgi:hypothetical protein